jgi:hypothetical protein
MSNARKPKAKASLFEQARNAKARTEKYLIPLVERDEGSRLWSDLDDTKARLRQARALGDEKTIAACVRQVAEAQAAFDEGFRTVVFRGLPPKDLDTLANEHPEPEDGETPDGHVEFIYWLAVACSDEDVTAEQWKHLAEDVWPTAEGTAFRRAVLDANYQDYAAGLGKG